MIQNTDIARRLGYLNISDDRPHRRLRPEGHSARAGGHHVHRQPGRAAVGSGPHRQRRAHAPSRSRRAIRSSSRPRRFPATRRPSPASSTSWPRSAPTCTTRSRARGARVGPCRGRGAEDRALHRAAEERSCRCTARPRTCGPTRSWPRPPACDPDNIYVLENGDSLELSAQGRRARRGRALAASSTWTAFRWATPPRTCWTSATRSATQGFASVAAAVNMKDRKRRRPGAGVAMHGITGGDDYYLAYEAENTVAQRPAQVRFPKDGGVKELRKGRPRRAALASLGAHQAAPHGRREPAGGLEAPWRAIRAPTKRRRAPRRPRGTSSEERHAQIRRGPQPRRGGRAPHLGRPHAPRHRGRRLHHFGHCAVHRGRGSGRGRRDRLPLGVASTSSSAWAADHALLPRRHRRRRSVPHAVGAHVAARHAGPIAHPRGAARHHRPVHADDRAGNVPPCSTASRS